MQKTLTRDLPVDHPYSWPTAVMAAPKDGFAGRAGRASWSLPEPARAVRLQAMPANHEGHMPLFPF